MFRGVLIFNTSNLGSAAIVDSAILSIKGASKSNALGTPNLGITLFSPASNTTINAGDYDSFSNTRISNDFPYASWSISAYNNITFTDTSGIDPTGYFPIMLRDQWDIDNNSSGLTWASATYSRFRWVDTSTAGTSGDPFLTITYHTAGGNPPVASFTLNKNFIRIPNTVTATDTSTNTPTSWQWSWGDGTANSTTQNPTHQYLKRGKFDIYLTATNAGGSGSTANPTSVKVVGYENYY
jgi:PKD repeat protein